jgi:hypothetical protein
MGCESATFKYHDWIQHDVPTGDEDNDVTFEGVELLGVRPEGLPNNPASEPDLINFKEPVFVGRMGARAEWPRKFDLEEFEC